MDIETHNDLESIAKRESSMWLGCYIDEASKVEEEASYFYTMREFITRLDEDTKPHRNKAKTRLCNNVMVYIYNLSFEWSFLLPVLLEEGYSFKEIIESEDEKVFNSVSTKSCSSVWQVNIKTGKKNGIVQLRDLSKLYGGGLAKVAKSFGLETQKGEIDYRLNRLHNYKITKEEKEYCFKDTRIIIEVLEKMVDDKDFWKSISMASYSMLKLVQRGYPRALKPYLEYRKAYPELSEEENAFLREGVEGGITYAPVAWQFKDVKADILHIDAHQMHPSSAYFNLFPYGEGTFFIGKPPLGYISACRIKISYDDVILHSIIKLIGLPFISHKEIVVWSFEIPTMYKCYVNLKIEFICGYAYKCRMLPWRKYYSDNYYKRLEAKKNKDAFLTLYYKLLNNSSYGKHLEKPHNTTLINYINPLGIIDSEVVEKDEEHTKANAKYTYLPVGSCIPAYSRVTLIETAFKINPKGDKILYFDTDSIFFIEDEETLKNWAQINQEDFLGGWALEEKITRAQFTAPKRYKTISDDKLNIKMAGINFNTLLNQINAGRKEEDKVNIEDVPFDEINIISNRFIVQRAFRCKGGTLIDFQDKEISVQPKYRATYEKNTQ